MDTLIIDNTSTDVQEEIQLADNEIMVFGKIRKLTLPVGTSGREFTIRLLKVMSKMSIPQDATAMEQLAVITNIWDSNFGQGSFDTDMLPNLLGMTSPEDMRYLKTNGTLGDVLEPAMKSLQWMSQTALAKDDTKYALKK